MKVIANRGVCIGVERHLKAGDIEDLDAATVQFLTSIGAVSVVVEPEPAKEPVAEPAKEPVAEPAKEPTTDKKVKGGK
jgi:hypothetical protein